MSKGLSQLGRTADGLLPAFLTATVRGTDLGNAAPLAAYPHLQSVQLPDNRITDLRGLANLQHLTHVDASGNKLTQVLDLRPAPAGGACAGNLRSADFSRNAVEMVRDLSPYSRLTDLRLDYNRVERIGSGLAKLRLLKTLSLEHNKLVSLQGLEGLANLKELRISHNCLSSLEPLSGLSTLQVLSASHNKLAGLAGTDRLGALRQLDVSNNLIGSLEELSGLQGAQLLSSLDVSSNPLDKAMCLRLHIVYLLPQVVLLNSVSVAAKEKVLAGNMHGADAEGLRLIRRKFFPTGELDDGGGAIPPMAAGLVASTADEEMRENMEPEYVRVDAWAASLKPGSLAAATGASLITLADQLSSVCIALPGTPASVAIAASPKQAGQAPLRVVAAPAKPAGPPGGQLPLARAVWRWVSCHVAAPATKAAAWSVDQPLFAGPQAAALELLFLGGATGTWAERVALLFKQLARGCELEAVCIPGYWKNGDIAPGARLAAHNHCWVSIKVNGQWRLMDPAGAAMAGGHMPFYIPPDAFIYSYWPLEGAWQLLPEPLGLDTWWALPCASLPFFARGCSLGSSALAAVNELPPIREGQVLPTFMVPMAAPRTKGTHLRVTLTDTASGAVVAQWPPKQQGAPQPAFQQVVSGKKGEALVSFGAARFLSQMHQLWVALPGPGSFEVEVSHIEELPGGGLHVAVEGLGAPLLLRVVEETSLLRVKVVLPSIAPHSEAEDGILHDPRVVACHLPAGWPLWTASGCQMVAPLPCHPMEADRHESFNVVVPGASRVALSTPCGELIELPAIEGAVSHAFAAAIQVPRAASMQLVAAMQGAAGAAEPCEWVPLLDMQVLPQGQHIVFTPQEVELLAIDPTDTAAYMANDIFKALDRDADGLVSRRDTLLAFRRNRQHADILKCPPKIHAHDGTFDKFVDTFLKIDTAKLGLFTFNELANYMGVRPSGMDYDSEDDFSDMESDEANEDDLDEPEADGEGEGTGVEDAGVVAEAAAPEAA